MHSPNRRTAFLRVPFYALAAALAIALSGCEHKAPDQMARAVSMGEQPVAMAGTAAFFGGSINATVTISYGIGRGMKLAGKKGGEGMSSKSAYGKDMPDFSGMDPEDAQAYLQARRAIGSPMPPVTLRLKLENASSDVLSVEILDMNSDLGNFAVQPALLNLAPRQAAEPDAMTSQLGVDSDDIPFLVTLRAAGRKESQTIHVRSIPVQAPALR